MEFGDWATTIGLRGVRGRVVSPGSCWERRRGIRRNSLSRHLKLVGLGSWWGRSQFNGRGGEDPHGCIGLVLSLAPDVPANRIAPAYIDIYDADWVVRPRDSKGLETRAELEAGIHGVL